VAPALVVYVWALQDFAAMQTVKWLGPWLTTKLGWIAAFIYCACAALRLARFNTTIEVADKRFFQGLPSPAAACVVAGLVWALNEYQVQGANVRWLAWGLTVFAGPRALVADASCGAAKKPLYFRHVPHNAGHRARSFDQPPAGRPAAAPLGAHTPTPHL
jgi:uncharacterized membrane protein